MESRDFKTTVTDTILKPLDSGKTFFDISVNASQICMGFEADTPEKRQQHGHYMRLSDKDLVKKVLTSNNFLTRSLSESR